MEHCILVVEDDRELRESVRDLLEYEGYTVQEAAHGGEAWNWLERRQGRPCAILLDLMMPVMDGWEFRRLQEEHPLYCTVPTVVITAAMITHASLEQLRPARVVLKPFQLDDLLGAVGEYCRPA